MNRSSRSAGRSFVAVRCKACVAVATAGSSGGAQPICLLALPVVVLPQSLHTVLVLLRKRYRRHFRDRYPPFR